jgi:hypothetical protein
MELRSILHIPVHHGASHKTGGHEAFVLAHAVESETRHACMRSLGICPWREGS